MDKIGARCASSCRTRWTRSPGNPWHCGPRPCFGHLSYFVQIALGVSLPGSFRLGNFSWVSPIPIVQRAHRDSRYRNAGGSSRLLRESQSTGKSVGEPPAGGDWIQRLRRPVGSDHVKDVKNERNCVQVGFRGQHFRSQVAFSTNCLSSRRSTRSR